MKSNDAHKLAEALFGDDPETGSSIFPDIEGYTLIEEVGRGGAGVVYLGVVQATGRRVAVKILHSASSKPAVHALHELDRLASVRSQVVPHVFEHGWADGQMYIVTEFIEGVDPVAYTKGLDIRGKVELLVKISDAVGILNSRGLIHRDLKPSNLLITSDGSVVIIDLGISMLLDSKADEGLFMTSNATGTVAYMSPEQARGENRDVSTRWDVYALGAVAYRILTGSTPYEQMSTVTESLEQIRSQEPRSPRTLCQDLPNPLSFVLSKACAFDASDRYETAQLLRDDLQRWLNHEPVSAGPQTAWMNTMRLITNHPVLSVSALCVIIFVLSMATTGGVVWWQNKQPYRFEQSESEWSSVTSIQSRSGMELQTWRTEEKDGIRYLGKILESDKQKFAVVGLHTEDVESGHTGLLGYKLGEYKKPAWVAEQHVPDGLSYAVRHEPGPHDFYFMHLIVEDIFPDRAGLEIVSAHRHRPYSVCAIQIHSADGELLSEYYHDGWVENYYWNPVHEQLVCIGPNSDGNWFARGADELGATNYPLVIFAVHPQLGEVGQVIRHPGLEEGVEPDWYRCLMPRSAYSYLGLLPERYVTAHEPNLLKYRDPGFAEIQLGDGNDGNGHVTLEVDHFGRVVDLWASDTWSEMHGGAEPGVFRLENLPERSKPRDFKP